MSISGEKKSYRSKFSPSFIESILILIGEKGWHNFQLADLLSLENADSKEPLSVEDLRAHFSTKDDLIPLFQSYITEKLLSEPFDFHEESTLSEKLFEIIMRRFDLMAPHRRAFLLLQEHFFSSPTLMLAGFDFLQETTKELFSLAGEKIDSVDQCAFTFSYTKLLKTWSADETPDLSKTMAQLDQLLSDFFQIFDS